MKTPGIYQIRNVITGKVYIGSSRRCALARISDHRYLLLRERHPNRHLQGSWNRWGYSNFVFEVIERANPDECRAREQFHIDRTQSSDPRFGYNLAPDANGLIGYKHTEQTRANMRAARALVVPVFSEETRRRISARLKGNKHSLGVNPSAESRAKMSAAQKLLRATGTSIPAINSRKTHCDQGHPLEGDNLYLDPQGGRECQTCRDARRAVYFNANRERVAENRRKWRAERRAKGLPVV